MFGNANFPAIGDYAFLSDCHTGALVAVEPMLGLQAGKAPVLASFGHDPLLLMVAGTEVPNTISEYAYAGAMAGEKVDFHRIFEVQ